MKIGQEITIKENSFIQATFGKEVIEVKTGDKAIITKKGIKYITGDARNKINIYDKLDIKGYDIDNICKRIVNALKNNLGYDFEEYLEDSDLSTQDLENIVWDELSEYI